MPTPTSCMRFLRMILPAAVLTGFFLLQSAHADAPPPAVTAFVDVNLLPMDSARVLSDQTVLVEDGKIKAIGSGLPVPAGATVIDGHGTAYLSPALADMHVHSDTSEDMKVYLANGITTVLNMGHASEAFMDQLRPAINRDELPGPHVYVGLMVDGSPQFGNLFVTTPNEARAIVDIAKTNGYDFIKVYNDLSPACFQALIEAGRRRHIHVIGHGVTRVGLEKQLAMGQVMVAHTEEFLYTVFSHPDLSNLNPAAMDPTPPKPADIPHAIAFVKRDGAFVTADLNTYGTIAHQWGKPEVVAGYMHSPELRYVSPLRRTRWINAAYDKKPGNVDGNFNFLKLFTKDMADAGVSLIAGTDAPSIPGLVPGFSLHDDMDVLEAAGLSRYQVLSAATRIPGEFIHRYVQGAAPFGTVAVGNRADLILTAANPLDGLSTLRKPLGVMHDGHWYDAGALQALLDGVAKEYDESSVHP